MFVEDQRLKHFKNFNNLMFRWWFRLNIVVKSLSLTNIIYIIYIYICNLSNHENSALTWSSHVPIACPRFFPSACGQTRASLSCCMVSKANWPQAETWPSSSSKNESFWQGENGSLNHGLTWTTMINHGGSNKPLNHEQLVKLYKYHWILTASKW